MKRFAPLGCVVALVLAVLGLLGLGLWTASVQATHPGPSAPLLTCPNVDGSADNGVRVSDILMVVNQYFKDWPSLDYMYLTDLDGPYNPETGSGGEQRVVDILVVVGRYFATCPVVDTQLAQATLFVLNDPEAARFVAEDPAFLASRGYLRGAQDLPGHGIHYVNLSLMDGVFSPTQPEGLAYNDGRLVSYVYYADGDDVGWGDVPSHSNNVEIDAFCTPVPPNAACSFDGSEDGWHDHVWLCIWNFGTPEAFAYAPLAQADCESSGGLWDERSGWMLHLHNHTPNPNGRFANCFPDVQHWKAYNCPQ